LSVYSVIIAPGNNVVNHFPASIFIKALPSFKSEKAG
jgi:hypothetical protein